MVIIHADDFYEAIKKINEERLSLSSLRNKYGEIKQNLLPAHIGSGENAEYFFFNLNLLTLEIEDRDGIGKWLGYNSEDFSFKLFLKLVHPSHTFIVFTFFSAICMRLCGIAYNNRLLTGLFVQIVALKHWDGQYVLVKNTISVAKVNEDFGAFELKFDFVIISHFNNEPARIRMAIVDNSPYNKETDLLAVIKDDFESKRLFSAQELRLLKEYAHDEGSSYETLLSNFKIQRSTVNTYNKRILKKVSRLFARKFETAKQAACYLKDSGLI